METTNTTEQGAAGQELQLVSFELAGEEYGIDILRVQEINRMIAITRVPNAPEAVEGVINLRGKVIPVMSLRAKFGLPAREHDKQTRIIVVNVNGRTMGIVVDAVSEVLRLQSSSVQPPPAAAADRKTEFIRGIAEIGERLLILLDLEKIFGTETA